VEKSNEMKGEGSRGDKEGEAGNEEGITRGGRATYK
jgi:hypothetical protein